MASKLVVLLAAVGLLIGLTGCPPAAGPTAPAKTTVAPDKVPDKTPAPSTVVKPPDKVVEKPVVKPVEKPAEKPVVAPAAGGLPEGKVVADRKAPVPVSSTTDAIKLDGKLAEPAWKTAAALVGLVDEKGQPAKADSRVLLTYDKDNLYVAVICAEPNTDKLKTGSTEIWNDDSVELYLSTDESDYFAFHVNPKNAHFNRRSDLNWDGAGKWSGAANVVAGKAWVAEFAIPFKTLGVAGKAGTKFTITVGRVRVAGMAEAEYTALAAWENTKDTSKYLPVELK